MQNAESSDSVRGESRQGTPDERKTFYVNLGKLVPPGAQSAKIKGEGYLTLVGRTLTIDGVDENGTGVITTTVIATLTAFAFMIPIVFTSGLPAYSAKIVAAAVGYVSYHISRSTLKKAVMMTVDANTAKAYYMQKRGIACLELPDERWIAVRAIDAENPALLKDLRQAYGDRLAMDK